MGNKLGRRRQVVEEKHTRPQGLYQHKDVDHKKLRKLILESKLAPCYPGDEDCSCDLEECPICYLYYPTLNRSRCCLKSICTECFLQMKTPNSTRPTQCPFCKTSNYAVEYRGAKTKEERGLEQIEEQQFLEAKIRMRRQEVLDEEERTQKRLEMSSSGSMIATMGNECTSTSATVQSSRIPLETDEIASAQNSRASTPIRQQHSRNRDNEFDLDLEDIMVMEAIWLSIQEKGNGMHVNSSQYDATPSRHYQSTIMTTLPDTSPPPPPSSSPSGGLACAIAALAERQQMGGSSSIGGAGSSAAFNTVHETSGISNWVEQDQSFNVDCGSEVAEAGTSYASSESVVDNVPGLILPESYEEQMMLAMAVSLAEAQTLQSAQQGVAWH